jgi:transcriptional regulator GlxA family with amidase domain
VTVDTKVPLRSRVLQFTEEFIADAMALLPELAACQDLLETSRRGALFSAATAELAAPLLAELVTAQGIRRIEAFLGLLGVLSRADVTTLTSASYLPDPSGFMSTGINEALAYINANLTEQFSEADLAEIAGLSASAFSRSFRRHTGQALVKYVNRLRINLACQLLMGPSEMKITDVCFSSGFNNISNFNRQFQVQKGMTPSRFRELLAENQPPALAA